MNFKKDKWDPKKFVDPSELNFTPDILDNKMAKNIVGDLKKNMPAGGFPKPQIPASALIPNNMVTA